MHSLNTIKEQNKSNAKKLIDLTIKNGGVSFNNNLEELPFKTGFAVAYEEVNRFKNSVYADGLELEKTLNKLPDLKGNFSDVNQEPTALFYGLWSDSHTINGSVYDEIFILDKVALILDYQTAVEVGIQNYQTAIYDFKNKIGIILEEETTPSSRNFIREGK